MTITLTSQTLFPNSTTRRQITNQVDPVLEQARQNIPLGPVSSLPDMEGFLRDLHTMDFDTTKPLAEITEWIINQLQTAMVHMTHPGYMGLFNPAPNFPSEYADKISAVFNPQVCVWSHAPVAVEIEAHVIKQVAKRANLPNTTTGHFTSGGSEANATALLCALTTSEPGFAEFGTAAFSGQPRIYVSAESHLAWLKIAHQSGIGRQAVRLVATDGQGRMDPAILRSQIVKDKNAGDCPIFIGATAGTTNAAMVDPLFICLKIAREFDLWNHVDAAWGGALIASKRESQVLLGMEQADSITIDAHKWFATTMGTGMFLTPHKDVLSKTFRVTASYMPSNDIENDLYVNSVLWSRRFLGLRLFMALASAGWDGYAQHVEHGIDLIDYFNERMRAHGWNVLNDTRMAVSCLYPPKEAPPPEELVNGIVAAGQEWISVAKFEGKSVVRVCITNGTTSVVHIDQLISKLVTLAEGKPLR